MNAGLQAIVRRILPALLALTLGAEAQAADTPPELFPAAVPGEAKALPAQTTARSDWSSAIIFVNRATTPRNVRIERFASGPTGTFDVTIARRGKDGATTQLPKGALVPLDAGTTLDLVASATLAKPGAYTIFLRLLDEQNVELSNAALTVTRASDMLPSEGIVTSPVPTRFFSGTRTADLSIELDGLQARPLDFMIRNLRVIRVNDGGESDTGLAPGITMACDGAAAQAKQPYSISENGRCTLSLTVAGFDAGDYRVRFDLAGTGGGARAVELPFKARTGSGRFILLLIAGGVLGGFLSWWRDTEQPRTREALAIAIIQGQVTSVTLPGADRLLAPLVQDLQALRTRIADGDDLAPITEQRTRFAARVGLLQRVAYQWALADAANKAKADAERDAALRLIAAGDEDQAKAAVEALENILFPRGALGGGAAAAGVPTPSVPAVSATTGLVAIRRIIGTLDVVAIIILFFFFLLVAVASVWSADADWGSLGDQILAFLIGAGAFGGMATTLSTFRSTIASVRGN